MQKNSAAAVIITMNAALVGFTVQVIDTASDEHGAPCGWCEDNDPCTTNIYYRTHEGHEMAHTCGSAACIDAATEDRDTDYDTLIEVSTAPFTTTTAGPSDAVLVASH